MIEGGRTRAELLKDYAPAKPVVLRPVNQTFISVNVKGEGGGVEDYITGGVDKLGDVIGPVDVSYNGTRRTTTVNLQLNPNRRGHSLFERIEEVVSEAEKNKMYLEILEERNSVLGGVNFGHYLGEWEGGSLFFRGEVGEYLNRGYEFLQSKWRGVDLTYERLISSEKGHNVATARSALMYCLRNNFPSDKKGSRQLSYPEIGKIFGGKNHSTIILAARKVVAALPDIDKRDLGDIGAVVGEIVGALGGIK